MRNRVLLRCVAYDTEGVIAVSEEVELVVEAATGRDAEALRGIRAGGLEPVLGEILLEALPQPEDCARETKELARLRSLF